MAHKYVIVTPVKNEEKFFGKTINSVLQQEILPARWIIINDGSTDRTGEMIAGLAREHPWVTQIDTYPRKNGEKRRIGGQAVIMVGMNRIQPEIFDFIVRMDADVAFDSTFFRRIFAEFEKNPKLGIASGVCYAPENGKFLEEKNPQFHTRGPMKIYRSPCYQAIGGLDAEEGWDTIDEVKANMLGWQTKNFPKIRVIHQRKTQTASGTLAGFKNRGITAYYVGYHPVYALLRSFWHSFHKPYFIGGFYMLSGFLQGYIKKRPQISDSKFIAYLRTQQLNRLLGKETIWK